MKDYKFIFAHKNDKDYKYPGIMDWYYEVDGYIIGNYLKEATKSIKNARKSINSFIAYEVLLNRLRIGNKYSSKI